MVMKMLEGHGPGATDEVVDFIEKSLRVKFPEEFVDCVKQTDMGVPALSRFKFIDPHTGRIEYDGIVCFESFNPKYEGNILRTYFSVTPDVLPPILLPFAETGDEGYLCFDYSKGFEDQDPPIVHWMRSNPDGEDVASVAGNFKEFLEKLELSWSVWHFRMIDLTEQNLRVTFPVEFISCIIHKDRSTLERPRFEFVHPVTKEVSEDLVSGFLSFDPSYEFNILRRFFIRLPLFPYRHLAFAETSNGNMLCFDYTIDGFEDKDPPVVLWLRDCSEGKNIVDIAITFKEFLEKLKPDEDEA